LIDHGQILSVPGEAQAQLRGTKTNGQNSTESSYPTANAQLTAQFPSGQKKRVAFQPTLFGVAETGLEPVTSGL
jgi:hypothetical protein